MPESDTFAAYRAGQRMPQQRAQRVLVAAGFLLQQKVGDRPGGLSTAEPR